MNEQKARYAWNDYVMRLRVAAVINQQTEDAELGAVKLAAKNRKNALDAYLKTLAG